MSIGKDITEKRNRVPILPTPTPEEKNEILRKMRARRQQKDVEDVVLKPGKIPGEEPYDGPRLYESLQEVRPKKRKRK